jgi:hypothetical protein
MSRPIDKGMGSSGGMLHAEKRDAYKVFIGKRREKRRHGGLNVDGRIVSI